MNNFEEIGFEEDQNGPFCLVSLVLDASSSMLQVREGEQVSPLESLNSGLDYLYSALYADHLTKKRIMVSFTIFGTEVQPPTPFATVENLVLPNLDRGLGTTSTGAAINAALDAYDAKKQEFKSSGTPYYKGFVLLLTDGIATDDISTAAARIKEGQEKNSFAFFPIAVEGADLNELQKLSNSQPVQLKPNSFENFFEWVSASAASVSQSNIGDKVALPSPAGWAEF